jgi:uncharacterized membrane protein
MTQIKEKVMEVWVKILILGLFLLIPIALIISGLILYYFPPNPNTVIGYRSPKALKNDKNWYFAQELIGKLYFRAGIVDIIISVPLLLLTLPHNIRLAGIIYTLLMLFSVIVPIIIVELNL